MSTNSVIAELPLIVTGMPGCSRWIRSRICVHRSTVAWAPTFWMCWGIGSFMIRYAMTQSNFLEYARTSLTMASDLATTSGAAKSWSGWMPMPKTTLRPESCTIWSSSSESSDHVRIALNPAALITAMSCFTRCGSLPLLS